MCETERQAEMELIEFLKFTEQDDCDKYNMLQQSAYEIRSLENKNQQLKEVVEKVREYINHEWFKRGQLGIIDKSFQEWQLKDILQILDKVGESDSNG